MPSMFNAGTSKHTLIMYVNSCLNCHIKKRWWWVESDHFGLQRTPQTTSNNKRTHNEETKNKTRKNSKVIVYLIIQTQQADSTFGETRFYFCTPHFHGGSIIMLPGLGICMHRWRSKTAYFDSTWYLDGTLRIIRKVHRWWFIETTINYLQHANVQWWFYGNFLQ